MNMKQHYFIRCMIRYGIRFIAEIFFSYILVSAMVKGNTMIGSAVDTMLKGGKVHFQSFILYLLLLTVIGFAAAFLKSFFASQFSIKVQTWYKNLAVQKLYRLEYRYFDANSSAAVINKMNSDIAEADMFLNETLPNICTDGVALVTYSVYVGRLNLKILLFMLLCYPAILYIANRIAKKVANLKKRYREKSDLITEIIQDCVNGILVLQAFGAENYFQKKLDRAADNLVENEEKRARISNTTIVIGQMFQWIPNIICTVYAYFLVRSGNLTMGSLIAFILVLGRFAEAFMSLPFSFVDAKEQMVCIGRVEKILCEPEERGGLENLGTDNETAVSFKNVDFQYKEGKTVLKDLSFIVKTGSRVAFVGESGGGKSTVFHILCGFYKITEGSYRLFGREFEEWDVQAAREKMALVSQNVFLFPSTIYENVRYGNQKASKEEIFEACKKARIHDFIMGLPEGYDTVVGERGILISGGERQRISIARAFLKNAPILLLDEPTSAVDAATETMIQEAIDKLSQNKTCITIAHRLSTIKNADKIMVLKDGKIAESGSHAELMKKRGIYAGFYGKEVFSINEKEEAV